MLKLFIKYLIISPNDFGTYINQIKNIYSNKNEFRQNSRYF